jgi:hypothetical protein
MTLVVSEFSNIGFAIAPGESSLATSFVVPELANIRLPIGPRESPLTVMPFSIEVCGTSGQSTLLSKGRHTQRQPTQKGGKTDARSDVGGDQ